jgi:hypothetical protein
MDAAEVDNREVERQGVNVVGQLLEKALVAHEPALGARA